MKIFSYLLIFFLSFNIYAADSPKWGPTGHRTIGDIADKHLTHKARKNIEKLLKGHSLAFVSTFGDDIKSDNQFNRFKPWHYVNYPFGTTYKDSQKNPSGDVVYGIDECIRILKDKKTSPQDQEFYLKLLVHLVGDLHQPMHAGLAEDKGGNDFQVRWFNKGTNLHRLWDSDMIEKYNMSYTELSDNMVEPSKEWILLKQKGSADQWVDEVHLIAEKVYQSATIGQKLSYRYSYDHFETLRSQLYLAGIRQAKILNDIYG
jgi:hypothetical protein